MTSPSHIAPYSILRYLDQIHRVIADVHGKTVLGSISAVSPAVLNNSTPATRPVSNTFPTSQEPIAPTSTVFVGPNSLICQLPNVITRYGSLRDAAWRYVTLCDRYYGCRPPD